MLENMRMHRPGRMAVTTAAGVLAITLGAMAVLGITAPIVLGSPAPLTQVSTHITAPSGTLITGSTVRFVVRTPVSLRSFSARLGGHDVTSRFRRTAPGRYVGVIRWVDLVTPGQDSLEVVTVSRSGGSGADAREFVFGRRATGYGSALGLPRAEYSPGAPITVRLPGAPILFSVRLDGRDVTDAFAAVPAAKGTEYGGRLAADDGLRYGRNTLQIVAAAANGAYITLTRSLQVSESVALAGAGPDVRTVAGAVVTLNGSSSQAHGARRLEYRWTFVQRPTHSRARLVDARSVRATLRPDLPGHYLIRLTVSVAGHRGATASDVSEITAELPAAPIGAPVSVGSLGITFNGKLYPFAGHDVIVLSLDRQTLGTPILKSYTSCHCSLTALQATRYISSLGNTHSVMIAANPGTVKLTAFWSRALAAIGAPRPDGFGGGETAGDTRLVDGGWAAVGVPGTTSGGYTYVPDGGAGFNAGAGLSGRFQYDASVTPPGFVFVKGDYTAFDTSLASTSTTNTMRIGPVDYASTPLPAGCTGGLHLLILAARDLQYTFESTVPTNCADPNTAVQGLEALDGYLHNQPPEYATQGRHLVFLQTIGSPWSTNNAVLQARYQVGVDLSGLTIATNSQNIQSLDFGGTAGVFNTATSGYALAGGDDLGEPGSLATRGVEASESMTQNGGSVGGILRRDAQSDYEPVYGGAPDANDPAGVSIEAQLPVIANQAPTSWPTDSLPDAPAILKYVAVNLLGGPFANPPAQGSCYLPAVPDVRSEYCNLGIDWNSAENTLQLAENRPPAGYNGEDWKTVTKELVKEMQIVWSVYHYVSTMQSWLSNTGNQTTIQQVVTTIDTALQPPASPPASSASWWTDMLAAAFGVAQVASDVLDFGEASPLLSAFSAVGWLTADLIDGPGGNPELTSQISQQDITNLATELTTRYSDMQTALGHFGDLIVTDYGKLEAFNRAGIDNFDETTRDTFRLGISIAAAQFAWSKLLPTLYNLDLTFNGQGPNPNTPPGADQFVCWYGGQYGENYRPFGPHTQNGPATAAEQYVVPIPYRTIYGGQYPDSAQTYVLAGPGIPGQSSKVTYVPLPKASLISNLFQGPTGSLGDITQPGFFAPWFYEQTFRNPRIVNCGPL